MARTKKTAQLRRCTGSARFGIEPHEAPIGDFPKQPSRKDGLGAMCTEHWRRYVRGLRDARASARTSTTKAGPKAEPKPKRLRRVRAMEAAPAAPRMKKPRPRREPDPALAAAEQLLAELDALPADEHASRVGDDDVQAALELTGRRTVGAQEDE